jgi:hypothetical protein
MFPISADRDLSYVEIADYWSREIHPRASRREIRDELAKAWWRGELSGFHDISRVGLLRALHKQCPNT